MVKSLKKIISCMFAFILVALIMLSATRIYAQEVRGEVHLLHELDSSSNFFTQVEDTRQVSVVDKREELLEEGYVKAAENNCLIVYFKTDTFGLAVYDKSNGYTWYSEYQDIDNYDFGDEQLFLVRSGIILEYNIVDSKGEIQSGTLYYSYKEKNKQNGLDFTAGR